MHRIGFYFFSIRSALEWVGRKPLRFSAHVLVLCLLLWSFQMRVTAQENAQSAPSLPEPLTPYIDVDVTVPGEKLDLRITRVDLWQQLPDGTEPQNDRFLVLLGALVGRESTACVGRGDFSLQIGDRFYDVANRQAAAKRVYGLDYPGGFFGQCASPGEVEPTFLIFDVEDNTGAVQLVLDDRAQDLQLDYAQLQAVSIIPDPTAIPKNSRSDLVEGNCRRSHLAQALMIWQIEIADAISICNLLAFTSFLLTLLVPNDKKDGRYPHYTGHRVTAPLPGSGTSLGIREFTTLSRQ